MSILDLLYLSLLGKAPDQTAPDQTAPDQTAPDQTAPRLEVDKLTIRGTVKSIKTSEKVTPKRDKTLQSYRLSSLINPGDLTRETKFLCLCAEDFSVAKDIIERYADINKSSLEDIIKFIKNNVYILTASREGYKACEKQFNDYMRALYKDSGLTYYDETVKLNLVLVAELNERNKKVASNYIAVRWKHGDVEYIKGVLEKEFRKLEHLNLSNNEFEIDVVIGKLPYSVEQYLRFINLGHKISRKYTLVSTPSDWMNIGASSLEHYRAKKEIATKVQVDEFITEIYPKIQKIAFSGDSNGILNLVKPKFTHYMIGKDNLKTTIVVHTVNDNEQ